MHVAQLVEPFLSIPENLQPVVSVYLNTWWQNEHHRDIVRVFVQENSRHAIKQASANESGHRLVRCLEWIENFAGGLIRQHHEEWATGVAIFCAGSAEWSRVLATRVPFEPMEFVVDSRPWISPMLRSCRVSPPILLVNISGKGGDLFQSHCGVIDYQEHMVRSLPNRHPQNGFSQSKQERYFEEIREKNLQFIAERMIQKVEENPYLMIVLAGQQFLLRAFEEELPDRLRMRVVARLAAPKAQGSGQKIMELMHKAQPMVEDALRSRLVLEREHILAAAARGGLGAVGVPAALTALSQGRVHRLLVDNRFHAPGWKCTVCASLGQKEEKCPYCGGAMRLVDYPEEILRSAVLAHAEVDILPPEVSLPRNAGIMAQLRF